MPSLPLADILVVAVEQAVAAPFATRQLADYGARVIKVERPPQGDFARQYDTTVLGLSSHFVWLNRSKESIMLDLRQSSAKAILRTLIDKADVFVYNMSPAAFRRLGLDLNEVRRANERLIACGITGYGTSGPLKDRKAYDLLVQAETGLLSITGTGPTPSKSGIPVADIAAGMYAFSSILLALYDRERTGLGRTIEVSLFDALSEWMGFPSYFTGYSGTPPDRSGAAHATLAPYGPFACRDDKVLLLAVQNEQEWVRFCTLVIDRPDMATDSRFVNNTARVAHRDELERIVAAGMARLSIDEAIASLERASVAYAQMRSVPEFLKHPQHTERGRWSEVHSSAGPLRALKPPADLQGIDHRFDPIPDAGAHTEKILAECGLDPSSVEQLIRSGAACVPSARAAEAGQSPDA